MSVDPITATFGVFKVLRLASYFPQIVAVARDRHGATAISFYCWSLWIGANASTALYAWAKLGDLSLALISWFNAASCAAVLLLACYKRLLATCPGNDLRAWAAGDKGRTDLTRLIASLGRS